MSNVLNLSTLLIYYHYRVFCGSKVHSISETVNALFISRDGVHINTISLVFHDVLYSINVLK